MLLALVLLSPLLGVIAFFLPGETRRPWLVPLGASAHLLLTAGALGLGTSAQLGGWLVLDPLGERSVDESFGTDRPIPVWPSKIFRRPRPAPARC